MIINISRRRKKKLNEISWGFPAFRLQKNAKREEARDDEFVLPYSSVAGSVFSCV